MSRLSRKKRALYAAAVCVTLLGGSELVLRAYDFSFYFNFGGDILGMPLLDLHSIRRTMNRAVDFDPYLFWKFKPDQVLTDKTAYRKPVSINSHGYRGSDFSDAKPDGVYRVACIGDSTTFGWSVADTDTFPARLELALAGDCPHGRVEVLNLGVTGYTSLQGRELMTRYAAAWAPDLVVFAFGPNDRLPALKSDLKHLQDRTWDIGPLKVFLNRLQVYKLIKSGVIYLGNRTRGLSLDPATYIPRLKRKVSLKEFEQNVWIVNDTCRRIGADLVIISVDYPSLPPDHVTREMEKQAREHGAAMPETWGPWDGASIIKKLSRELGAPAIDMRELFARSLEKIKKGELEPERAKAIRDAMPDMIAKEPWWYIMVDNGHPNQWGHEIIARKLELVATTLPSYRKYCGEGEGP